MSQKHPHLANIILLGCTGFFALTILWQWHLTTSLINDYALAEEFLWAEFFASNHKRTQKPDARTVKGIYLTAYSANNKTKRAEMIDLIDSTELNAVVIDIKDYTGYVLYDSDVDLINQLKLEREVMDDVSLIIEDFHARDIYVIARQTVFQDPVLAERQPMSAIKSKAGGLWRDDKGLAWVDPTRKEVWEYNVAIAREAIDFGFDEVQFDYVRFPTDGNMSLVVYTNGTQSRHEVMGEFYSYMSSELKHEPAWLSIDIFGFVMEYENGLPIIGQRLTDMVDVMDYVSPMMYPSHYGAGHLGLENPAAYPGLVIANGMKKGMPYFENTRAKVRPWLQAFNIGAVYGAANIRAQIDAVEAYDNNGGWLLWNAANRYSSAGLK